ncbi:MAG: thioredoxin domain-containing protein, partial [Chthoniobacterales bacterium]|nr:thioredoxin domain-containing protein [Chthoniobacterales bacterium]
MFSAVASLMASRCESFAVNSTSPRRNRLASEKSPYLLQHADNPVDWLPWGEEAFARARTEQKPIFLSVGYSTCHWCHVMAHESFEEEATAEIMNREFVNIKVDREERPDVDRVYMTFVQATTGHGGWPMSVWLTPDLKPFVGGTYFPPEDRFGHPGFKKVLQRIAHAWKQDHENIAQQGTQIVEALQEAASQPSGAAELTAATFEAAYRQIARSYDAHEGGFGSAPKFPRPVLLHFLFRIYGREREGSTGKQALEMNLHTLRKMAAGGLHDHLGGGFARYSVDQFWHVPHFEKMLYDNAQLAVAYTDAFQITREPLFENVTRDILEYVLRDMTAPEGGFYSAEDADSTIEQGKPAHAEGAFYVWTEREIDDSLGSDAALFKEFYGVEPQGNAPAGADPHGEFAGKNILILRKEPGEAEEEVLARGRARLLEIRAKRPRPHLDDKIITAWNGLMISGFARAAQVLQEDRYAAAAERAAQFIRTHLYHAQTRTLVRNYRGGPSAVEGFADDYAFLIQGLLDLYEASFRVEWVQFALELQETQDRLFWDAEQGGYFSGTGNDPSILLRLKEDNDGAEPAASSVAALNLLRLAQIRGDAALRERAEKTIAAFSATLTRVPG